MTPFYQWAILKIVNMLTILVRFTILATKISTIKEHNMNIYICVGSSCHIKGSYDIIQLMKEAIAEHHLEDKINLSAAFCLGRCTDGVSVKINDTIICGVSRESFPDFFQNSVLSQL